MIKNVGFLKKYENENEKIALDMSPRLASGEGIVSATSKCFDSNGLDASSLILEDAPDVVNGTVYQPVTGGVAGEEYKIIIETITTESRVLEDHILLIVSSSTPTTIHGVDDLQIYDDENKARQEISANATYDVENNADMCKRFIAACRRWLALSEDSMTHGSESVQKSANSVENMLKRAEKWLINTRGMSSPARTSGVRFYSARGLR